MLPINSKTAAQQFKEALALISARRYSAARTVLSSLAQSLPAKAEVPFQLARIATLEGKPEEAGDWLEKAEALAPKQTAILTARIAAETAAGRMDAVLAAYDRLARLSPGAVQPLADKAVYLQQIGDFDAAEAILRRLLKKHPVDGELFRILVATRKLRPGDPLLKQMQDAHKSPQLTGLKRAHLDFALAKAFEDIGAYDRVMRHLKAANQAVRAAAPYEIGARRAEVRRVLDAFRGGRFAPRSAEAGFRPIFVTGLPRSGSTLFEQILASHPEVTGGDELGFAVQLAEAMLFPPGGAVPGAAVPEATLQGYRAEVELRMRRAVRFDRVVTDKAMQSYLMAGFLPSALPGARVIIVDRDPRDLLLSIYKNVFAAGQHLYAYDMADLAEYYVIFREVLDFWAEAAPGAYTVLRYDDLVAAPEAESRALVAAAGLSWDPACLEFHKTDRRVTTVSLHQVRQPIYRGSVAAWKRYEEDLAPMFEVLDKAGVLPT